jgi:hypothetical protein
MTISENLIERGPPNSNKKSMTGALHGLDMVALRVLPEAFDKMSVEHAEDILARTGESNRSIAWMNSQSDAPKSANTADTFVIKTRTGKVGLLQLINTSDDLQAITMRYRLRTPIENGANIQRP